jgi:hypothetical protein
MNLPSVPLILVIAILAVYFFWKFMNPQKKKPAQRRFSIRKYRKTKTNDEVEENESEL